MPVTTVTLTRLEKSVQIAGEQGRMDAMEDLSTKALHVDPVRWPLYVERAYSEVYQPGKLTEATADFQVARALEPHLVKLCFDEGHVWLEVNQPDLCVDAWLEALRRSNYDQGIFNQMMSQSSDVPLVREALRVAAQDHLECLLVFLDYATLDEAKQTLTNLMTSDPDLHAWNENQRQRLFRKWWDHGDRVDLIARLANHRDWQNTGWPYLAQSYADQKDFQQAWDIVSFHAPAPAIPILPSTDALPDLERTFYSSPDDLAAGITLLLSEIKQGKPDDALATLHTLENIPQHPKYLFYLEAQERAEKQQFELAWNAWQTYSAP